MADKRKNVLVLYSGGRDSSCAAIEMARIYYRVKLYTFQPGLPELTGPQGDSAPDIRHAELTTAFPELIDPVRAMTGNMYLIRKLGLEQTNETHVVYPLVLALSFFSFAILYCLENDMNELACGYSGYQATRPDYVEQNKEFVELTKSFLREYGLELHLPVLEKTEREIKDILERFGISSNSLENKSVFGGLPFDSKQARSFWDASTPVCRDYIDSARKAMSHDTSF